MKSLKEILGNVIDYKLIEKFSFVEGEFTFIELKELLGKKSFAEFLIKYLEENSVKIETTLKNGFECIKPIKLSNNMILKFWVDSSEEIQDVSLFQPKTLF